VARGYRADGGCDARIAEDLLHAHGQSLYPVRMGALTGFTVTGKIRLILHAKQVLHGNSDQGAWGCGDKAQDGVARHLLGRLGVRAGQAAGGVHGIP
jgi:hypothetical protein